MTRPATLAATLAIVLLGAGLGRADAQTPGAWKGHGFASVDAGVQATSSDFTSTVRFTLHAEEGTFDATYEVEPAAVFSGRGGIRIWKNLAAGVGVTYFSRSGGATVTARLPHPFYFSQFREVAGTADRLRREEVAVSVEASWMVRITDKMDMQLFAGPAFFSVRQDMATMVQFRESYPFDAATLVGLDTTTASSKATGFTAGADVSYMFSKAIGLGGTVRFSRATTDLTPVSGQPARVTLGGAQASGGLRLRF